MKTALDTSTASATSHAAGIQVRGSAISQFEGLGCDVAICRLFLFELSNALVRCLLSEKENISLSSGINQKCKQSMESTLRTYFIANDMHIPVRSQCVCQNVVFSLFRLRPVHTPLCGHCPPTQPHPTTTHAHTPSLIPGMELLLPRSSAMRHERTVL